VRCRAGRFVAVVALLLCVSGCGGGDLWTRWQAERGVWRAQRAVQRIEINPRIASAGDWSRAGAACRAVASRFPAAVWSSRARTGAPLAADVLEASGRAALLLARLDDLRGRPDEAIAGFDRVRREYRLSVGISEEAAVSRARLLDQEGRAAEAEEAWGDVARDYPPADPRSGVVFEAVMDAPLILARERRARGDERGVDSVLRAAEAVYLRALPGQRGLPAAPALWFRMSEARSARGDAPGALEALRQALADPAAGPLASRIVLTLAERALEGVGADTALAYAHWAARGFDAEARAAGLLVAARAWRARGAPDSALQSYEALLEEEPGAAETAVEARFARARLLEDLGRWDQARGEYHALAGTAPTHPLALEGMLRVVRHHLGHGERELGMAEARHALEALDAQIATQQDDSIQVRAGETRARLLFEMADVRGGCGELAALLRRYPEAPLDATLLVSAAEVAETRLSDIDLALVLERAAAVRASDPELRRRARAAAERLAAVPR
jgi:tetratricopeptide (TPR) repeat protein